LKLIKKANVLLDEIMHNDSPCYIKEGFGGKRIEHWPMYSFFCQYVSGNKGEAIANFSLWYRDQFDKYCKVSKRYGGMLNGSLYKLIQNRHRIKFGRRFKNLEEVKPAFIDMVILERVTQRMELLDDIMKNGYIINKNYSIAASFNNNKIIIEDGHHRAAILKALGYESLPCIFLFQNNTAYRLFGRFWGIWKVLL
jgi:hypothetical protein